MQIIDPTIEETDAETGEQPELLSPTGPLSIDMLTPVETCLELGLVETQVVDLVNAGRLPAYRLGGHVRFRVSDVARLRTSMRHLVCASALSAA